MRVFILLLTVVLALPALADDIAFFESRIRPVLVEKCYACHSADAKKVRGGLRLDTRAATLTGGDTGPAVVAGKPDVSLLLIAIGYGNPDLKMPPEGKLPDAVLADFRAWIAKGAPDPRINHDVRSGATAESSWEDFYRDKSRWWSFQPLHLSPPPTMPGIVHPVDRFVRHRLSLEGVAPAPSADPHTLLRRVTYTLTGLPPTPAEIDSFLADCRRATGADGVVSADVYETLVDRLLASPRFGERFATHWLDLFRYAESHGSEGDPPIPDAWRYRDYVIRALNADVPYSTLVTEHLAGDLMPSPRGSESLIGLASLRFMEHGFQPVESLEEQAKTIDNQIDTTAKAFLGLTIDCARCHDHKFDPVSQRDYTALYDVFASVRPAHLSIDDDRLRPTLAKLAAMKPAIREALAAAWLEDSDRMGDRLGKLSAQSLAEAAKNDRHPLYPWAKLSGKGATVIADGWSKLPRSAVAPQSPTWDLRRLEHRAAWTTRGVGVEAAPAGAFALRPVGDRVIEGIYPAGIYNHLLSSRAGGLIASPRFAITGARVNVQTMLGGGSVVRVVIDDYPLGYLDTFPQRREDRPTPAWAELGTNYRKGATGYIELAAFDNQTVREMPRNGGAKVAPSSPDGRSAFGIVAATLDENTPANLRPSPLDADPAPTSDEELAAAYGRTVRRLIGDWTADRLTDEGALMLDGLVRANVLRNDAVSLPRVGDLLAAYRAIENALPTPARVPAVIEAGGQDARLHVRGNPRQPAGFVPRAAPAILGGKAFGTSASGRLELATAITDPGNALSQRVIVNRIWQWVFGAGLVATPDNFGHLGVAPSHPELLDFLASRFATEHRGSIKALVRELVLSQTFRQSSQTSPEAFARDPSNRWLGRADVRRLDAEQVRDGLLLIAGAMDEKIGGPGVWKGPLDEGRRSIYLQVRRSEPHSFLSAFDKPAPSSTRGRRDVTTQPAQALALLNAPLTQELSSRWGKRLASSKADEAEKLRLIHLAAVGREPTADELRRSVRYVADAAKDYGVHRSDQRVWQDLALAYLCLAETTNLR